MTGVVLGREHWYGALARRWNRAWGDETDPSPTIYVRQAGGRGWWVVVEPQRGIQSVYFADYDDALHHADGLHSLHGWPVEGRR